jgi:hypothetical protein
MKESHEVEVKNRLPWVGKGIVGALIGSICCLLPAAAIALGLTGGLAITLVSLGRFRLYGVVAGIAFVAIASWFSLRRIRPCCTEEEYKAHRIAIPLTMLASFVVGYGVVMYLIVPLLYRLG